MVPNIVKDDTEGRNLDRYNSSTFGQHQCFTVSRRDVGTSQFANAKSRLVGQELVHGLRFTRPFGDGILVEK